MIENYLEGVAFTFLSALIRSYIRTDQIIIVIFCTVFYVMVFRDYNKN